MAVDEQDDVAWTLLARYLGGTATLRERADVERRAGNDPGFAAELEELRRSWERAGTLPSASRIDSMWQDLARRMAASGAADGPAAVRVGEPRRRARALALMRDGRGRASRSAPIAIAAALLLVAGGALMSWRPSTPASRAGSTTASAVKEFRTERGQRATIVLIDGSQVELGVDSRLLVHPFAGGRREVSLEGEAVFVVTHDSTRPFLVRSGNALMEDLGTRFVVRAYPGDSSTRVVVVEGLVALRPLSAAAGAGAILEPGDLGRLDQSGRVAVEQGADTAAWLAWTRGRLAFTDATLAEVAAQVGRWYDVTVVVPDSAVAARRLTVDMPARALSEVLAAVTVPLKIRFRREGERVVLGPVSEPGGAPQQE